MFDAVRRSCVPRRVVPLAICVIVLSLVPRLALAQSCGDWRYPVLCRATLQVSEDGGRWEALDGDELTLAPNGRVELRLDGQDQWDRSFRSDRLMLGVEDRDCDRLLEVTDRGEAELSLEPRSTEGRCRLHLWVPGNLNFEWEIEVSVESEARTGYARGEAELLARSLYRAILGRDSDAGGLAGAVAEIERGRLESQVQAMVRSDEFRQSIQGIGSEELVGRFYEGLLGRSPGSEEIRQAAEELRRGNYAGVVLSIVRSAEFEERLRERF